MRGFSIKLLSLKMFYVCFLCAITDGVFAAEDIPSSSTVLENPECIQCHQKLNNSLIKKWQNSAHSTSDPVVDCVSCHGKLHKDIAIGSRHDETCIECHGGKQDPVVHSYSSSKHGILMQLENDNYDWNRAFELANYRAPGCGYCHMHRSNHDVSATIGQDLKINPKKEEHQDAAMGACFDCHSPRYITRLFENGEAMLEIAHKKVREADALIEQAEDTFSDAELEPAKQQRQKMQHHLKNVYLGVGHQSPDYQWWHGQPALDGDLLRIKDSIGELYRLKK